MAVVRHDQTRQLTSGFMGSGTQREKEQNKHPRKKKMALVEPHSCLKEKKLRIGISWLHERKNGIALSGDAGKKKGKKRQMWSRELGVAECKLKRLGQRV